MGMEHDGKTARAPAVEQLAMQRRRQTVTQCEQFYGAAAHSGKRACGRGSDIVSKATRLP